MLRRLAKRTWELCLLQEVALDIYGNKHVALDTHRYKETTQEPSLMLKRESPCLYEKSHDPSLPLLFPSIELRFKLLEADFHLVYMRLLHLFGISIVIYTPEARIRLVEELGLDLSWVVKVSGNVGGGWFRSTIFVLAGVESAAGQHIFQMSLLALHSLRRCWIGFSARPWSLWV